MGTWPLAHPCFDFNKPKPKPKPQKVKKPKMVKLKAPAMFADDVDTETGELPEIPIITPETTDAELDQIDAAQNAGTIYRITVPMPAECQTAVTLFFLAAPDLDTEPPSKLWTTGFYITRSYDTQPNDQAEEEQPDADATEENWSSSLGEAVLAAVNQAAFWITCNSNDGDQFADHAVKALEDWKFELDAANCTESMFDAEPEIEQKPEPETPAAAAVPKLIQVGNTIATPAILAKAVENVNADHETLKQDLAWEIARGHMALAKAKADAKRLTKAIESAVAELEELEEEGPEKLPLFDQAASRQATPSQREIEQQIQEEPGTPLDSVPPDRIEQRPCQDSDAEPWRTINLQTLTGITDKLRDILSAEKIVTLGDWVDWPIKHQGLEYTQIKGITEKRLEKIAAVVNKAVSGE